MRSENELLGQWGNLGDWESSISKFFLCWDNERQKLVWNEMVWAKDINFLNEGLDVVCTGLSKAMANVEEIVYACAARFDG